MGKTVVIVECKEDATSFTINNNIEIFPDINDLLNKTKSMKIATIMAVKSKDLLTKNNDELNEEMNNIIDNKTMKYILLNDEDIMNLENAYDRIVKTLDYKDEQYEALELFVLKHIIDTYNDNETTRLTRKDLCEWAIKYPINKIHEGHFKESSITSCKWETVSKIIFIDDDKKEKILKNRFGKIDS